MLVLYVIEIDPDIEHVKSRVMDNELDSIIEINFSDES